MRRPPAASATSFSQVSRFTVGAGPAESKSGAAGDIRACGNESPQLWRGGRNRKRLTDLLAPRASDQAIAALAALAAIAASRPRLGRRRGIPPVPAPVTGSNEEDRPVPRRRAR